MARDTNALRARIASELNKGLSDNFGNSGETFATACNRAINQAIEHYESQPFRWNQVRRSEWATATAYSPTVSLPADFLMMTCLEVIYSGRYYPIPKLSVDEANQLNYQPSMTSASVAVPAGHAIEGNVLVLAPPLNAARTLAASYIRRYLPTSVTGSYTAVAAVGGNYTLTATSTASHNGRTNGWTNDGADLICARAKADIKINYLNDPDAKTEMSVIASRGEDFLCVAEKQAYTSLKGETFDILATGRVRKYGI